MQNKRKRYARMCTYLLAAGESYVRAMVRRASHLTADKISSVFLTLKRTLLVAFVFFWFICFVYFPHARALLLCFFPRETRAGSCLDRLAGLEV